MTMLAGQEPTMDNRDYGQVTGTNAKVAWHLAIVDNSLSVRPPGVLLILVVLASALCDRKLEWLHYTSI